MDGADREGRGARLVDAAGRGDAAAVEALLAEHGDLADFQDEGGGTALMAAARRGHAAAVRALLRAGANPNASNAIGRTALMWAARSNAVEEVRLLLDGGADVTAETREGLTALAMAALAGHAQAAAVLVEGGADPSARLAGGRWEGRSARDIARQMGKAAVALALGPRLVRLASAGDCGGLERALQEGDAVDDGAEGGCTPLIAAVKCGHLDACKLLVSAGAALDAADENGDGAIVWAARSEDSAVFDYLIEAGARVPEDLRRLYATNAAFL